MDNGDINCTTSIVSVISDAAREVVEAVLSRREIDGCVLTADLDERLGLITCRRALFGLLAKAVTSLRSSTSVHAHSRI